MVADAARRFNVAENAVVLASAERLTWSDGSLGCPEPGQMYTQMLVAGISRGCDDQRRQMLYHTDSRGTAVTCAAGTARPAQATAGAPEPLRPRTPPRPHRPPQPPPDR